MDNFFFGNKSNNNYSRTYSKGTSFKFSVWNENDTYNNDEFVVDFVQWDKSLWAAKKTSTNVIPSEGDYWELIVKGVSDIEFRQIDNRIEYRYIDPTSEWKDLFELASVSEDQIKKMLEDLDIKYGNTYDTELSETSTNAVQNQAIAKKFKKLDEKNTKTDSELVNIKSSVTAILSNAKSYTDSKISETKRDVDTELEKKVDKVSGKGLSTNDFNNEYKAKLDNLNSSLNNTLSSAKSYTNSEITKVDNKINSEISRAKTSETNLSNRIDDLEEGLTNALNEAKEYTDSEVKNNTNKINILNGTGEGSVTKTVKDEIAKVVDAAPEELDTLREIAAKLADSEDVAAGLVETLSELETKKADKTALNNLKTETDSALQSLDKTKANTTGTYPSMRVGTADDLAGRGESVPAEFGFRASGGKSIKDGRAYIKRIKGNSVVWNQGIKNGNFASKEGWSAEYGTLSVSGNVGTYTLTNAVSYARLEQYTQIIKDHSYLLTFNCKTSSDSGISVSGENGLSILNLPLNADATLRYNSILKANASSAILRFYCNIKGIMAVGDTCEFSDIKLIDLTKMFGAGNEPSTIEEFNARVATLGVDLNAYNEGQVIHCNTESIKSVGDNAWDEEWEMGSIDNTNGKLVSATTMIRSKNAIRVIPGSTYYYNIPNVANGSYMGFASFYDNTNTFVSSAPIAGTAYMNVVTPSNAKYMRFYLRAEYGSTYNHDIMISLVHSGWKQDTDAGYQPYWADTLPLPIIRKYFPDGMKSTGIAHDEIRFNKASGKWEAVQRIAEVDLGTLKWETRTIAGTNYFLSSYNTLNAVIADDRINNERYILCAKYQALNRSEGNAQYYSPEDKVILLNHGYFGNVNVSKDLITIWDSSYTDAATFKAAMQGVILYYEAADWEWVELDAEDQNFRDYYNVADFGTEMSQSAVPSANFSADIIYQFNAVDMIREHELEITELQKVIATMQAQLASLTSN